MSFVTLTKKQFEENCLPKGWRIVDDDVAKEIIYEFPTEVKNLTVRVFSTVDKRDGLTRDIGTDAIRIVFWANNRPIGKGKRIHRTEGRTTIGERIQSRIQEFLSDARSQDITDFDYVRKVLEHDSLSWNNFAQSLLENLDEKGFLTDGQLAYVTGTKENPTVNPKGKLTMEIYVREKDSGFGRNGIEYEEDSEEYVGEAESISEHKSLRSVPEKLEVENVLCWNEEENPAGIEEVEEKPVGLVPTSEFKEFQYSFPTFNPVQSMVFPVRNEDCNFVIGANTSAGKTIAAEIMMEQVLARRSRL